MKLAGKTVILTGASSGLGAHFAPVLHEEGAHVILVARRGDMLDRAASGLSRVTKEVLDLRDEDAVDAMVVRALSERGSIDVLINNAGIWEPSAAEDESTEQFRRVVETNLVSLFAVSRIVGRAMLEAGTGSIINMSSINALIGVAESPAGYSASKAGVNGLTQLLAAHWAGRGVRVNAIAPGPFPSELNDYFADEESAKLWGSRNPTGRIGRVDELDGLLIYLASDASTYVNGQVISVDGGWSVT